MATISTVNSNVSIWLDILAVVADDMRLIFPSCGFDVVSLLPHFGYIVSSLPRITFFAPSTWPRMIQVISQFNQRRTMASYEELSPESK